MPRTGKYIVYDQDGGSVSTGLYNWMRFGTGLNAGYANGNPFPNAWRIVGGMDAWKAAGYPTGR